MRRLAHPLLLAALAVLAVSPALMAGRAYIGGDLLLYFYPFRKTLGESLSHGVLWAWDPGPGCGTPFCADPQAICFDPAAPLYALFSLPRALALEAALRMALAAIGTYVFLRGRRVEEGPALLFSAPAGLGGVAVSLIGRTDKLGAFAALPWVFAAVDAALAGRRWGWPVLALALALGASSGGLEVWAMAAGGAMVWALAAPDPAEGRTRDVRQRARALAGVLASLIVSFALLAVQWLPFKALLAGSSRGGGLSYEAATSVSMHPARLLGLVIPELFYDPNALTGRLYPGAPAELYYVLALSPAWITLVFAALSPRGDAHNASAARLLGGLSLACAVLALGRYLPGYSLLFEHVPGFSLWRYPEKFIIPLGFSLPAMAGLGAVGARGPGLWRALVYVGLAAALGGALLAGPGAASQTEAWMEWCRRVGGGLVAHGLALSLGALALSAGRWRLGLIPLLLDLLLVQAGVNPTGPASLVEPSAASTALPAGARVEAFSAAMGASMFVVKAPDLVTRLQGFRAGLYPNMGLLDGLHHTDSVRAIRPAPTARLFGAVEAAKDPTRYLRLLELAGTDAAVSTREPENTLLAAWPGARRIGTQRSTGVSLWALDGAAPRVYRTERAVAFPSPGAAIRALAEGEADPRAAVVLVSAEALPAPQSGAGWQDGEVQIVAQAPGELRALSRGDRPGWLVSLETWDPGWRAEVAGAEAEIRRAQGAFMAVAVPAGQVEVTLRYEAPGRRLGALVSGLTALGLALGWGLGRRGAPAQG